MDRHADVQEVTEDVNKVLKGTARGHPRQP